MRITSMRIARPWWRCGEHRSQDWIPDRPRLGPPPGPGDFSVERIEGDWPWFRVVLRERDDDGIGEDEVIDWG
jgi:hypothetical protein